MRNKVILLFLFSLLFLGARTAPTDIFEDLIADGGPLHGMNAEARVVQNNSINYVEDFDMIMPDWPTTPTPWVNSGVTLTIQGAPSGHIVRALGGSVFVMDPGTAANTGVHARFSGTRFLQDTTTNFDGGAVFDVMRVGLGNQVFYGGGYWFRWAVGLSLVGGGAPWNSELFIGLSLPDSDSNGILVNTTGAITCGTSWVSDGGWGFHLGRDGVLTFIICKGSSATTRTVDLSADADDGTIGLSLGFHTVLGVNAGECEVEVWYAQTPSLQDWKSLGTKITGDVCPETDFGSSPPQTDMYNTTVEVQKGFAGAGPTLYVGSIVGLRSKE